MEIIWKLKLKKENIDYADLVAKISNDQDINLKDYTIGQVTSIVQEF